MISLKKLRNSPEEYGAKIRSKGEDIDITYILTLDEKVRSLKYQANEIRAERNRASDAIGLAKQNNEEVSEAIEKTKQLVDSLNEIENELDDVEKELIELMCSIPNLPHKSVPIGENTAENKIIREWGDKPQYPYSIKNHMELGETLNLFDFKRGSKISGSGFPLYTDKGAQLERILINAMIMYHADKFGFMEIFPPVLMKKESMFTTGQLPKFQDDMYHTEIDNLYLAPTAEVPLTNMHRDEILKENDLPLKYVAYTPCFRREAGSYGKDTRGLLRVHQFNKVELVKFTNPESSYDELESLTLQAESLLQILGLHYRVVLLCTGDLSFSAAKCYDLEVWSPGEKKWLEVSSCSNFENFQSRRGNIRYRDISKNSVDFVHTLNASGLATPRLMVALIETYQTSYGTIEFPKSIADFIGIEEIR
ncbi:MAG: serine--tRNA ligase [Candidatus Marinimicrobia bacterium]|nr:serine--tRNA ligase [Candidatus Neomarinimicrobiota bacterium]